MVSWRRSGGNLLREDSSITELGAGAAAEMDQVCVRRVRPGLSIMAALTTTHEVMWSIWHAYGIAVDLSR